MSFFSPVLVDFHEHLASAYESLKSHNIIAVPTDTIYGVAGLAQSTQAVRNLYNLKRRDHHKPISISVGDLEDVKKWVKPILVHVHVW